MKIALSTDHAGFEALASLKEFLESNGHTCINYGPSTFVADDDYPDFIYPAARAVASGEYECGIIFGGSGQGEAMVANRVRGVRCTVFYGPVAPQSSTDADGSTSEDPYEILKLSRQHNHANVLSLGGRFLNAEQINHAVQTWLSTPYSDDERHVRRVQKIDEMI